MTTSKDLFFGALPPPIGSLCVLPCPFAGGPFSRDFVPHRQTSSSASNIPFWIKLQSRQSHHHSPSPRRRKRLKFELKITAEESTINAIKPQRILPTASHHRVIARHSSPQLRVSAVSASPLLRDLRAHFGSWGPRAQGYLDCVGSALLDCVV